MKNCFVDSIDFIWSCWDSYAKPLRFIPNRGACLASKENYFFWFEFDFIFSNKIHFLDFYLKSVHYHCRKLSQCSIVMHWYIGLLFRIDDRKFNFLKRNFGMKVSFFLTKSCLYCIIIKQDLSIRLEFYFTHRFLFFFCLTLKNFSHYYHFLLSSFHFLN